MKKALYFTECEHSEDLERYKSDLIKSGFDILDEFLNTDNEQAIITVDGEPDNFMKFNQTESADFCY